MMKMMMGMTGKWSSVDNNKLAWVIFNVSNKLPSVEVSLAAVLVLLEFQMKISVVEELV